MIAETVSLGILSLPSTLKAVGLIPGVILLVGLGIIATYTGYVLGQFKLKYPQVYTFADAGRIIGGRVGYEICAIGQLLFLGSSRPQLKAHAWQPADAQTRPQSS